MFSMVYGKKRYLVIACLLAVLITFALLAVSCGEKGTSSRDPDAGDVSNGKVVPVEAYINELDSEMNLVDTEDFSDSELDDKELGL
ncbi:MAG: hypothetical protein KKE79_02225 [Actinobacteria bacterium]|nr:hypothetical protein [Actinomycetota bacterium]MBU4489432.1 hypothetical protein [Actinomycetota bacterium]